MIDLGFLEPGDYRATIYRDGPAADWKSKPYDAEIDVQTVNARTELSIDMAAGGGFAISLHKLPAE